MSRILKQMICLLLVSIGLTSQAVGADAPSGPPGSVTCFGTFPNPIKDTCWQCMFPMSIGAAAFSNGQEDIENPPSPICICPKPTFPYYRIGLEIGFWEPARNIEVTRTPYCFPTLEGWVMDVDVPAPRGAHEARASDRGAVKGSFYQAHYFINPIMYLIGALADNQCQEQSSFDLAYVTEFDPTWHNDSLSFLLAPESALFTNIVAVAACAADCVAASTGFGFREMFWCSGCNGHVYPLNGNVQAHVGGAQASSLIVHRFMAKLHREFIAWQFHDVSAVCAPHPAPLMDKRAYKAQMLYPIPMTGGTDGSGPNRCCQPFGRTTAVWATGREYPIKGEDFAYLLFRKRNCCASSY